jgi:two-component system sensor histidine kinase VicK
MRLVFNNLLGNALRYSPVGSELVIRVSRGKKYCEIQVADQGIGLDKRDRKKIFKRFYRVQNKETQNIEGAGLGLFIASEFVKSHKGFIDVFSEGRGKGATFTVGLPIPKQTQKTESI